MAGNRVTMRQKHWPTKEVFYDAGDTGNSGTLFPEGIEIDTDTEDAYIRVHVPFDFDALDEIVLVVIPIARQATMWIQVITEYNISGKNYTENTEGPLFYSFDAVPNRITEIDIQESVNTVALQAGDYIIVTPSRQAAMPSNNTDLYVMGVRFKYKYR